MTTTPELRELLNKATPGPWYVSLAPEYIGAPEGQSEVFVDSDSTFIASTHLPPTELRALNDAALIALAPELAAEVIRLREGIKALADHVEANSCGGIIPRLRALLDGSQS